MIPNNLATLDLDAIIPLYTLSDFNLLNPNETIRFCNYTGVKFEGDEYLALGCESEGFSLVGQGQLPNPIVRVSNVGRVISDWLYKVKTEPNYRLEGSTVTRVLTQRKFLDGQPNQNASIKSFIPDIFILNQVSAETYAAVEFQLATAFDIEGLTLPARAALRNCSWVYRSAECGWYGAMYDLNNNPTSDPSKDRCNKSLTACRTRYGYYAGVLPFGGLPGLSSV